MSKLKVLSGAANEIVMERVFDAPLRMVKKAMTTPDLIKRWLGGVRATVESVEVDLRVGGRYRYMLRTRDGRPLGFGGVFRELGEARVVQTESFDDYPGESIVTTTWTEEGGKTTMHIVVVYESQTVRDIVLGTGMADGAGESYDKLDEMLASL
jgi:uncharacterized protein YndB with AHSA1/START domain